jgi:hypothetical protein
LKQQTTDLYVADYHQIISQITNLYSRISGSIPEAASLLTINQNIIITVFVKPTATAAANNTALAFKKGKCIEYKMLRQTSPNLLPLNNTNICCHVLKSFTVWCKHFVFSSGEVKACK